MNLIKSISQKVLGWDASEIQIAKLFQRELDRVKTNRKTQIIAAISLFFVLVVSVFFYYQEAKPFQTIPSPNPNVHPLDPSFHSKNIKYSLVPEMKIRFAYPNDFVITHLSKAEVSLSIDNSHDPKNGLLIYSTQSAVPNINFDQPIASGSVKKAMTIPNPNFDEANILTLSDDLEESQIFFFKTQQQIVVVRPPTDKSIDPEVVLAIVNSIVRANE
jgi:hypothetical protein